MIGIYRLCILLAFPLVAALAVGHKKIRATIMLRVKRQRNSKGQPHSGCIWFHASSGEFEYARPVLRQLKKLNYQTLVTYYSPSYRNTVLGAAEVDAAEPLPFDFPGSVREFLHRHKPQALLIARTDLWPELLHQAHLAKVKTLVFSLSQATPVAWQFRWYKRWCLNLLDAIYCVGAIDKAHLDALGLDCEVTIMGDTRFDQAKYRLALPCPLVKRGLSWPSTQRLKVIFASTWPEDEAVIRSALKDLPHSEFLFCFVPHEMEHSHWNRKSEKLNEQWAPIKRSTQTQEWAQNHSLLVDEVGLLAALYKDADLAFVGGSFGRKVHSVLEPLTSGCPTLVGPSHQNSSEAMHFKNTPLKLQDKKMPLVQEVKTAKEMADKLLLFAECKRSALSAQEDLWTPFKTAVQKAVASHCGASERIVKQLLEKHVLR